jgi:hypothetical protein
VLLDGVEQGHALEPVAAGLGTLLLGHPAGVDGLLDGADDEADAELGHPLVAVGDDLGEVVAGVDVHEGERDAAGPERLLCEAGHDDRVLAAAEQQAGLLELGRDLTHDVDGLVFESVQVAPVGRGHRHPHVVDRVVGDGHDGASGGRFRRSGRLGGG